MRSIVLIILFPVSLVAQTETWIAVGRTGPSSSFYTIDKSYFLDFYWAKGVSLSTGTHLALTNSLWLSPEINYSYFQWDKYTYYGALPPEYTLRSSRGEDSYIYRALITARAYMRSGSFIRFYVLTGVGYTIERIGKIEATVADDINGYSETYIVQYEGRSYFTHILGAGFRLDVLSPLSFDFGARYLTEYSRRFHTSISAGIIYSFNL